MRKINRRKSQKRRKNEGENAESTLRKKERLPNLENEKNKQPKSKKTKETVPRRKQVVKGKATNLSEMGKDDEPEEPSEFQDSDPIRHGRVPRITPRRIMY